MSTLQLTAYQAKTTVAGSTVFSREVSSGVRLHTTDFVYIEATFDVGTSFTAADITTDGCSVSEFAATNAGTSVYSFKLTAQGLYPRQESSISINMASLTDENGNMGEGYVNFEFVYDTEAQMVRIVTADNTNMGFVRIPEGHSITPTIYQRQILNNHYQTRPAGYTPWTHQESDIFDPISPTSGVRQITTLARPAAIRKNIVLKEATRRLEETDWMVLSDQTTPSGFATYRSALRDVIAMFNVSDSAVPATVSFPEVPRPGDAGTLDPYPGTIKDQKR